jgi:ATP-dependent DNA helicase RecG
MTAPSAAAPLTLSDLHAIPVSALKGIGPKKEEGLAEIGVTTVLDLLTYYPRRWVDRTNEARVGDLREGEEALVLVTVRSTHRATTRTRKQMVTVETGDESGRLRVVFFNQAWRERQLHPGLQVALFGRAESYRGRLTMTNPVVDLIGDRTGRIVAVYPQSEKAGLTTWEIAGWVEAALARCRVRGIDDPVPEAVLQRLHLESREQALRAIHAPDSMDDQRTARRRLVFDELLRVQLALVLRKRAIEQESVGISHTVTGELVARFHGHLPFPLTAAQHRVIEQIEHDLAGARPMHRLLQGDVGSGKTVVAISALLVAVQGGHQGALMAPTEVLAEQHALGVRALLAGLEVPDPATLTGDRPLRVELLTNRTTAAERRRIATGLVDGSVDLLIGTHALIQEGVELRSLGVVVIDEQHRFGVEQRAMLREKGRDGAVPDVLVMTATPIPRTAAMTVYGDLDVSVLDEMPPGRTPIVTKWARGEVETSAVWNDVRDGVAAGHQAYVVCPLIDESEKLEVASATETFGRLQSGELKGLRLALLHGRVPASDKAAIFEAFRAGEIDVLVATTVIEVGVDVPNATVMVVLDASRFGIAQLHQLRGRVGRGAAASMCWLIDDGAAEGAEARLEALVKTTDGFELAEVDLDLRGEGTIMGERQKGRSDLRLASLRRDREMVGTAREVAFEIVDGSGGISEQPGLAEELRLFVGDEEAEFLLKG